MGCALRVPLEEQDDFLRARRSDHLSADHFDVVQHGMVNARPCLPIDTVSLLRVALRQVERDAVLRS